MNSRQLWYWGLLAAGLLGVCWFLQRRPAETPSGLTKLLPEMKVSAVVSVQVRPGGKVSLGIRAERTNHTWQLVEPLVYPAQGARVDELLAALESLTPAMYIKPAEIRSRRDPDEDFGFVSPQASIIIQQENHRAHVLVGALTPPGDQVYVQVVARGGVYVVGAELLKAIPRSANEWREKILVTGNPDLIDRLAVTNNTRAFILQRDSALWRMAWPLTWARADSERIEQALQQFFGLRIQQFISDEPKPDLEAYGLLKPELELALSRDSNSIAAFQFGKAVAGTTNEIYARRMGRDTVFTVPSGALRPWRGASVNDFRDPHLLTLTQPVTGIEVTSEEPFSLRLQTNGTWHLLPQNISADPSLVADWISALTNIQIVQFTKDVVNPPELPEFGLAQPARSYSLRAGQESGNSVSSAENDGTNGPIVELNFGLATNVSDRVFVRRADETSVYSIATNDFARLPSAGWQLQDRQLWTATEQDVDRLTIHQSGKRRELIRQGDHSWSLAAGSQGIIEDLAVEQTVRGLLRASARVWVARGTNELARFGLHQPHQLSVMLKSGEKVAIDFGSTASPEAQYAAVQRGGETFVLEFPWHVYRDIDNYLSTR